MKKQYTGEEVGKMVFEIASEWAEMTKMSEAKYKALEERTANPTRIMWRKYDEKVNFVKALVERAVEILEERYENPEWYIDHVLVNESLKECKEYLDEVKVKELN